jgi:AraC family transcriptional regulator
MVKLVLTRSNYALSTSSKSLYTRERLDDLRQLTLKAASGREVSAFYSRRNRSDHGLLKVAPCEGFSAIAVTMNAFRSHNKYLNGRPIGALYNIPGSTHIYNTEQAVDVDLREPFASVNFRIPLDELREFRNEYKSANIKQWADYRVLEYDPVMHALAGALIPALMKPEETGLLFIEHIFGAVIAHLSASSSADTQGIAAKTARLAPWQERKAKEMLVANLCADISLKDLAQICDLSVTYFARAFKSSVGVPPHRWLTEKRIENSKALLLSSDTMLADVALMSGFADQSHFTRIFTKVVGLSPGAWRRLHKN